LVFGSKFKQVGTYSLKDENWKFPVPTYKYGLNEKKLRKNRNVYAKLYDQINNYVLSVTWKRMTLDIWNFHQTFILAFSIHDNILKC